MTPLAVPARTVVKGQPFSYASGQNNIRLLRTRCSPFNLPPVLHGAYTSRALRCHCGLTFPGSSFCHVPGLKGDTRKVKKKPQGCHAYAQKLAESREDGCPPHGKPSGLAVFSQRTRGTEGCTHRAAPHLRHKLCLVYPASRQDRPGMGLISNFLVPFARQPPLANCKKKKKHHKLLVRCESH